MGTKIPAADTLLRTQVYDSLRDALTAGRFTPGQKLSFRFIARTMGVSLTPVREAIRRLVAEGALEMRPSRSVRVPLMTAAQFRDLTKVRIAIEGHAAAEAAQHRNDDDLAAIAGAEEAMRAESKKAKPDLPRAVELNKTFHFAVYEASHSPVLVEIIRALWLKAGPVINLDLRANPERLAKGDAIRFHADVRRAIAAKEQAAARTGVAADISGAAKVILSRGGLAN